MKINNYQKSVIKIISYILIIVGAFVDSFINDIDGRYALVAKGFYAFIFLYLLIVSVKVIIKEIILIRNKKKEKYSFFVILISIIFFVYSLLLGARNVPAISRDIIDGKCSTSLEISDKSKIIESKMGNSKYYISGITLNGKEITFEVSDTTYFLVIVINRAKKIDIIYWKHSKTLYGWDIGLK